MTYRTPAFLKRKAEYFERKAAEADESSAPWALRNIRLYQDYASRAWVEYYAACREAGEGEI